MSIKNLSPSVNYLSFDSNKPTMDFLEFAGKLVLIEEEKRRERSIEKPREEIKPEPKTEYKKHDYTFAYRQTITSPTATSVSKANIPVPVGGELLGITVYTSNVDSGDFVSIAHGGRILIGKVYVYREADIEKDLLEPEALKMNHILSVEYYNAGTTSKNVDWTFHMKTP